jgi:penicillin amidase
MTTLAKTVSPRARLSPVVHVLLWLLFAMLVILAGAAAYAWFVAHSALPQLDGRLQISGISAAVAVTRDSHGVPTIEAGTLEDLFFAQGYVTAQDRLWQMDVMRRYGAGELSEILGEDGLKMDREQRILGLRPAARKAVEMLSTHDRAFFEAYARGVNAYIGTYADRLPIEFRILHYRPKPWLAEDSLVIANLIGSSSELPLFLRRAAAREDSRQTRTGVDRRPVCESLLARSPAHRDAARSGPTGKQRGRFR